VFQFEGKKRIAAEEAMRHPYFHCLGERTITLPDSEFTYTQTHTRISPTAEIYDGAR